MPSHRIPFENYHQSLLKELSLRDKMYLAGGNHFLKKGVELQSIFFGGGTPSLMPEKNVDQILKVINNFFHISGNTEITLEANPKTVTREKLLGFKNAGINRLSLGVQSFHDAYLASFGRIHSVYDAREAISWIGSAGFRSWNLDFIFGFPKQTLKEWEEDLDQVLSYKPPHLSCYAFTVESEAPYGKLVQQGIAQAPKEDLQADMMEKTILKLRDAGYQRYETSNYSFPGFESVHNLNYWKYGEYVGVGAGAVSFLRLPRNENNPGGMKLYGLRTSNFKSPRRYRDALLKELWFETEEIPVKVAMGEFMMMGLRLKRGVCGSDFRKFFGQDIKKPFGRLFESFRKKGLMNCGSLSLTSQGSLLANSVMADFLLEA